MAISDSNDQMRPGLWQMISLAGRTFDLPVEMLPHLLYDIRYDNAQTSADLAGSGIRCPNLFDYLPILIRYYENHLT